MDTMPKGFTHTVTSDTFTGTVTVDTGLFIGGTFVESLEHKTVELYNPSDGTLITTVAAAGEGDVDAAVDAAEAALGTTWGTNISAPVRGRLLAKLADLVERHLEELAALEALNSGRNFLHAKGHDMLDVISTLRYYAGWADKHFGQTIETADSRFAYTRHEPIGVCGIIVPWNFPLLLTMWSVAPALATGNAVVLKPSELTPLTALKLAALAAEAGFPAGALNVVPGVGAVAGEALATHPRVRKLAFTGSTTVGRRIMAAAAASNLKRVTLELGGKNPVLVFDDADVEDAVSEILKGLFTRSGQFCAAGTRIYIQDGIYETLVPLLVRAAEALPLGSGFEGGVAAGPLISSAQLERVLGYIEAGKASGAALLTGGKRLPRPGYFVAPTLFANVPPDASILREEIFGPVGVLVRFGAEAEVLQAANSSSYGLVANVYTKSVDRALRVSRKLEAGSAFVNMFSLLSPYVPFGGVKQSGFGRQLGEKALDEWTVLKAVHIHVTDEP